MNEAIGAIGGHNDQLRMKRIENAKKEKEDIELEELEKKVKKQQKFVLIKTLPIAIIGETFKVLYETGTGKKKVDKEEENSKWNIKEYGADHTTLAIGEEREKIEPTVKDIIVTRADGQKVRVRIPVSSSKQEEIIKDSNVKEDFVPLSDISVKPIDNGNKNENTRQIRTYTVPSVGIDASIVSNESIAGLDTISDKTLDKLKTRKIVEEYEKKLKDIRFEMRQLISDYNVLVSENDDVVFSSEAEQILDKLTDVILKIEELKRKIQIEDLDKYDDNYIYTLIEGYLEEFRDKRAVSEIKDSPLYIMIEEKLDELDDKKDKLQKSVSLKKDELEEKEMAFEALKNKFYSIDKINQELIDFQSEQDHILKDLQEKVKNARTVTEKVEVEAQVMNMQTRALLRRLRRTMLMPGPRAAKAFSATTAAYLYFMRQIINPQTVTRRYNVITVQDYTTEIKSNINLLDDAYDLLSKTGRQIDKMIDNLKTNYKDYFGVVLECDQLLSNLERVKANLEEKEYEMDKIKEQQVKLLETNKVKLLEREV